MLSNVSEFTVLLERYEDEPAMCSKLLRNHSLADPSTFLAYAQPAILQRPVSRALKFIASLAVAAGMVKVLVELLPRDRAAALALAKKMAQCEPRFDMALADVLLKPAAAGGSSDESFLHTALDLLEATSEGDRLVPTVLKLLKHPNPKIRSKAALFVGSRTQNVAWATSRSQEYDPRVRANILESLYGMNSDVVHQIFRNHVNDENNRAAGNAVLGLYQLGDSESIPLIYEMGKHPEPRFRNTCAWLMGKTGDPRFVSAVAELMQDPDEIVRSQAFKAMADLRRQMRTNTRPQLGACVLRVSGDTAQSMTVAIHDPAGLPVKRLTPMSFIVRGRPASNVLQRFEVTEHECRIPLNVAFVMCLPSEAEQSFDPLINEAVLGCHPLRRSKDRWLIAKLSGRLTQRPAEDESVSRRQRYTFLDVSAAAADLLPTGEPRLEYTVHHHRMMGMLTEEAAVLDRSGEDQKTKTIADFLTRVDLGSGKPHLLFVGIGPVPPIIHSLAKSSDSASIHVIAMGENWKTQEMQNLARESGGYYQSIQGLDEVGQACYRIHLALLHHYKINWNDAFQPVELEVNCSAGRALATYDLAPATEPVTETVNA